MIERIKVLRERVERVRRKENIRPPPTLARERAAILDDRQKLRPELAVGFFDLPHLLEIFNAGMSAETEFYLRV